MNIPLITLMTDFGLKDGYVACMKARILSVCPHANLVDITHAISPQDCRAAAYQLDAVYRFFPPGSIHVVVVDPGVGTPRKILCAHTHSGHYVLAPDNGIITPLVHQAEIRAVRSVTRMRFMSKSISPTFHGRDIFAPVSAHLAKRRIFSQLGAVMPRVVKLPWPKTKRSSRSAEGAIMHLDHYGNLITNIKRLELPDAMTKVRFVMPAKLRKVRFVRTYAQAGNQPVALWNSAGMLEIALNKRSAARRLRLEEGHRIKIAW